MSESLAVITPLAEAEARAIVRNGVVTTHYLTVAALIEAIEREEEMP